MPLHRLLRLSLLLLVLSCLGGTALAQGGADAQASDPQAQLDQADKSLAQVRRQLDEAADAEQFNTLAGQVTQVGRDAQTVAQSLAPQLADVKAQLDQLGAVPDGTREDPDLAAKRRRLNQQSSDLDSTIKRANLLATDAQQVSDSIERLRAQQLSEQLSTRAASPLSPALWAQLAKALPDDGQRMLALYAQAGDSVRAAVAARGPGLLWLGLGVSLLLALPLRLFLRHLGRRYAAGRAPGGRLRRSGLALWFLLVGTGTLGLAALVLAQCLGALEAVPETLQRFMSAFVLASFVAAFIGSLSTSLLAAESPSWRLFALDDAVARRLRWYCHGIALMAWLSTLAIEFERAARTSGALMTALEGVVALLYVGLIVAALACLSRSGQPVAAGEDAPPAPVDNRRSGVIVLVRLLGHLVVVVALLAALFGYLNLALMLTVQVVWICVVVAFIGLASAFLDDLVGWLVTPEGRISRSLAHALGVASVRVEQAGVLVSAGLRIMVVLGGLMALLAPYGTTLSMFTGWFDLLADGVPIGGLKVTPLLVGRALLVLAVGLWLVHLVQHWLVNTYLPKTELEPSSRNSVSTVARYLGWSLVALATLGTVGIGLSQLALVVSALSVGIGFGLQAITQNFISGLILLAERPVKIGDWVRIGDQEGDIRRINVRATEIQVGDRSTLIVPNSELITKSVRNMTLSNPMGRVQLQFSVPMGTDMARVRALLLEIYAGHAKVKAEPAPSVYIDSLGGGLVNVNSYAYVGSPRETYATRSDLFFALLQKMADEGVALQTPQDVRIIRDEPAGSP